MFSHCFNRSTAYCRKALGNLPTHCLATGHLLYCDKCANLFCLSLGVQSKKEDPTGGLSLRRSTCKFLPG